MEGRGQDAKFPPARSVCPKIDILKCKKDIIIRMAKIFDFQNVELRADQPNWLNYYLG